MGISFQLNSAVSYWDKPVLGDFSSKHPIMALAIDKSSKPLKGIARIITKRKGNVDIVGFVDKSKLAIVNSNDGLNWKIIKDLKIKGIDKITKNLEGKDKYFIGLEDPDIWEEKGIKHVYFTIAYKLKNKIGFKVYLGHAQGKSLESLKATGPILKPTAKIDGFKESCFSPIKLNEKYLMLNEALLFEDIEKGTSVISLSTSKHPDKGWKKIKIVLDPRKMKYSWIKGHASPCRIFPKEMINYKGLLLGVVNGREPSIHKMGKTIYRKFRPGLFLFNPKTGEIPWVSPKPLIEDPKATTITFASDFLQLNKQEGILYAHVNDSFVRAYKINFKELRKFLP
ncbi:hypothetical protein HY212_03110 [Candidatus Pacearchaeota archaeon]|nr:hypothetical protein [Candidatus Pacearchaeota archaeon]